ncbi:MAG: NADH dehydrogenase [Candidatus Aldehydirespiratoraceae bacterium]|jgi:NADH dehydrogenase
MSDEQLHVVIIGGGFGGIATAKGLAGAAVRITLIDRRNHHLFQPLLYQVATAGLTPADIAHPIRSILADQPNATVILGEVDDIDPDLRRVHLVDGAHVDYDRLVVATGTRHSYFGNDEWEQHAPGLKTIEDAIEIRRRVLLAFERAERTQDPEERLAQLTFVVVGGGPTGVETAGSIAEIAFRTLTSEFRSIDPASAQVILLEAAPRILGAYPEPLSAKAERQLSELGVDVRTDVKVTGIDSQTVETSNGTITARTVIWGAGNEASPLAQCIRADIDRAGRAIVGPDLAVPRHPEIFAIGDVAHAESKGTMVPGVAQGAMQGGKHAARAIRADILGQSRPIFRYRNKGELATIGRSSAVGTIGRLQLSGWIAWMAWWAVHIVFLIDFQKRFSVFISWAWSYLTFQRGSRLITGIWSPRERPPATGSAETDTPPAPSNQ